MSCLAFVAALCIVGCGEDAELRSGDNTTTTTASTAASGVTPPTSSSSEAAPAREFPPARVTLEHGGSTWAAILAGSREFDDPALVQAIEAAADAGYTTGPTDCDVGAPQAVGFDDAVSVFTVSVYFSTRSDAEQAVAAFRARSVDAVVAEVQTYCGD